MRKGNKMPFLFLFFDEFSIYEFDFSKFYLIILIETMLMNRNRGGLYMVCKKCSGALSAQAFSWGSCKYCGKELVCSITPPDVACDKCAKKYNVCTRCGISMKETPHSFSEKITGGKYQYPIFSKDELEVAKANNLVIVSDASDDLMELEGTIYDEFDVYEGGTVYFDKTGKAIACVSKYGCEVYNEDDLDVDIKDLEKNCKYITALWCKGDATWSYETNIDNIAEFNIIEEDEIYCKGFVFCKDALKV